MEPTEDQATTATAVAVADMPNTAAQLRALALNAQDLKKQLISVPEWGGITVEVREMMAKDRNKVLTDSTTPDGRRDLVKFYPLLTILSCYAPGTNDRIFELSDLDTLNTQGGSAMERVAQVAVVVSALNADALRETKNG